jgi:nitroimidazol reductase NimA-like FMN-containing flavoprotein (pyridoxamine 5'-phosphate oxidase superfamily)
VASEQDQAAAARRIIDANLYMVLGTADQAGRPWVSPVYFAPAAYREFYWVSRPGARHSSNLRGRRDVSIVVFDSSVPISTGQAVYMSADAEELVGDDECAAGIDVFSRRSLEHGGREWTPEDIRPPAHLRLYRATATEHFLLGRDDRRVAVSL